MWRKREYWFQLILITERPAECWVSGIPSMEREWLVKTSQSLKGHVWLLFLFSQPPLLPKSSPATNPFHLPLKGPQPLVYPGQCVLGEIFGLSGVLHMTATICHHFVGSNVLVIKQQAKIIQVWPLAQFCFVYFCTTKSVIEPSQMAPCFVSN